LTYILRNSGITGYWWLFLLIGAGATAVGAPRQDDCFLGGYAFGFFSGNGLLATLAQPISCRLTFSFSRQIGPSFYSASGFCARIQRIDRFLTFHDPLIKTIVIRLLPVG